MLPFALCGNVCGAMRITSNKAVIQNAFISFTFRASVYSIAHSFRKVTTGSRANARRAGR
jgi:hypothetical protein